MRDEGKKMNRTRLSSLIPHLSSLILIAVATALAVGAVECDRTPPTGQADSAGTSAGRLSKPSSPAAPPWFEDVTDAVGLNFTHECGPTGAYFMPQSMYGGV